MSKAPESLATRRLLLRRPVAADADAIFRRYASDPEVTRYMSWPTSRSLADTHAFLALCDAEWATWSAGVYLIRSRDDDALLGSTGLSFVSATEAITGYILAREAWGKGYATEALTAMVELATTLDVTRLVAHCHPDHRASQRVLEKCGFRVEAREQRATGFPNLDPAATRDALKYARALAPSLSPPAPARRVDPSPA